MAPRWQPGEEYNYGDIVEYEGIDYKIIQPHRSQSDWTPPVTPALWGRLEGGGGRGGGHGGGHRDHHRHREERWGEDRKSSPDSSDYGEKHHNRQREEGDQSPYQAPGEQPVQEQKEKRWYDVDEEDKKKLEIGGGIVAGLGVLGAGIYAYKKHQENSEEKEAHAWSLNNWISESQARTQQWRAGRYDEPVAWVWNEGKSIPRDAIQGGEERGEALYISRAYHEGGLLVGKASSVFKKGAVIGYKKDEIHLDKYEILVGDSRAVKWVPRSGQVNVEGLRPVEGGREPDGATIYIAQAPHRGAVHPGKACEVYGDGCFIPYDDSEKKVKEYAILCYA